MESDAALLRKEAIRNLFPQTLSDRIALVQHIAAENRPWYAPASSFGYSGSRAFAQAQALAEECLNDPNLFEARRWQDFYANSDKVTEETKAEVAEMIVDRLRAAASGSPHKVRTWKRLAKGSGIKHVPGGRAGGPPGQCMPGLWIDAGAMGGSIHVNDTYPEEIQARVWVHELAHLILIAWLPSTLEGRPDFYSYDDDRGVVSHQIARLVEELIFGA